MCFLNFDRNYKETLSVVIFASDYRKFPEPPEKMYLKKKIEVQGRIKLYKGRVEIVADSPEQIRIIE